MKECDLIMKGGVTSGVVYPKAIAKIAEKYRLRNIGGTSAGAIAAVFAAAAEYRRQGGEASAFEAVEALGDELASTMRTLFQPSPSLQPLFWLLLAFGGSRGWRRWGAVTLAVVRANIAGIALGMLFLLAGTIAARHNHNGWITVTGGLAGLLAATGLALAHYWYLVTKVLPRFNFGMCTGISTSGRHPGFTDWIAYRIDTLAGNLGTDGNPGDPLTVGQLAERGICVAAMTTDLSSGRPYELPLKSAHHCFSAAEFARILPERVVRALVAKAGDPIATSDALLPQDLYRLPSGNDFPVVLVARLSLSFPGLIEAVPLYRVDYGIRDNVEQKRRCLFSDGGITSNFPIQFFDEWIPTRPTLAIALTGLDERPGTKTTEADRIFVATTRRQSTDLPAAEVKALGTFVGAILDTARSWQETLQSLLPGYAERIVEIRLKSSEGGMNLNMDRKLVETLVELGEKAGERLVKGFDFEEHRWLRGLTILPAIEEALVQLASVYQSAPVGAPGAPTFRDVLRNYTGKRYRNPEARRKEVLVPFADRLEAIGADAAAALGKSPPRTVQEGVKLPVIDAKLRLVADPDRVPADDGASESGADGSPAAEMGV